LRPFAEPSTQLGRLPATPHKAVRNAAIEIARYLMAMRPILNYQTSLSEHEHNPLAEVNVTLISEEG
jgi:hypothetical protein